MFRLLGRWVPGSKPDSLPRGHDGLVVISRLLGRWVPGSKLDSTEDPSCIGPPARYIIRSRPNAIPLGWRGSQFRCDPRHLTAVRNAEVRPKIALVLLQNWTLM
ncbi:hypothetical protein AVEN_210154-1 [Araneus ventricosus]|uniref:Uncharacterized protein n=1 Tax=Araneus ventricosus TaxID=182803 RepID=A0A4Y2A8U3_ARAVE|nr:hypothetical protein AVEN_210154-1 [Araneus ventricosus]